ncbi:MAG: DUF5615 family PIN-like protein [Planctomycetes bacterium]|nr:DUF5615 family PIN-like protein [Planctomycetota bacterium]
MALFLVDEDLPRSLARGLRGGGVLAEDVRDTGLHGRTDEEVLDAAGMRGAVLVTADVGLADRARRRGGSGLGLVIVRYPNEISIATLVGAVVEILSGISDEDLRGAIVIVEPGRVRIRRGR